MAKCIETKYTNNSYNAALSIPTSTAAGLVVSSGSGTVAVAPVEGWRLTQLRLINTDTNPHVVTMYMGTTAGTAQLMGVIAVPLSAGNNGSLPAVDALNTTLFPDMMVDNAGNKYYDMPAGMNIFMKADAGALVAAFGTIYDYTA